MKPSLFLSLPISIKSPKSQQKHQMPSNIPLHQSMVLTSFKFPPIASTPVCTLSNIATIAPSSFSPTPSSVSFFINFSLDLNRSLTSQNPSCNVSPDLSLFSSTSLNLPPSSTFFTICCGLNTVRIFPEPGVRRLASMFASSKAVTTCGRVSALSARRPHSARQRRVA